MARRLIVKVMDENQEGEIVSSEAMGHIDDLNLINENNYNIDSYIDLIKFANARLNEILGVNIEIKENKKLKP